MEDDYIEFGIVYRIDDLDDGSFYIGQSTNRNKWLKGYLGSGRPKWHKHKKNYPPKHLYPDEPNAHEYKRTVIHKDIHSRFKLNDLELKEILKYSEQDEYGVWRISDPKCMNIKTTPQNMYDRNKVGLCSECNTRFSHQSWCSKAPGRCEECGYPIQSHRHNPTCSHYKELKACQECGGKNNNHRLKCSKYKGNPVCPECGSKNNSHKKYCSKFKQIICEECGNKGNNHKRTCSKFKESKILCEECGGKRGSHLKTCSKFKKKPCTECGSLTVHKKSCSKYKRIN